MDKNSQGPTAQAGFFCKKGSSTDDPFYNSLPALIGPPLCAVVRSWRVDPGIDPYGL